MIDFIKKNTLYSKLTGINILSKVGDRLFYTAMLTIAASLNNGSIAIMIVSASETLPIILSMVLGVVSDTKKNKLKLLVISSYYRALIYVGIALLFKSKPTLILVIIAAFLNLLSDIGGNFSSALISPFTKIMIKKEDMEQAQGLVSLSSQLVSVIATFIGALLLSYFKNSSIALINAFLFWFVGTLYWIMKPLLGSYEDSINIIEGNSILLSIKDNYKSITSDYVLLVNLIQLAMLNGFFGGLTPIFALFLNTNRELAILSTPVKISLLSGTITVFMIIGNAVTTKILRKKSIFFINFVSNILIVIVGIGFILNSFWVIIIANSCIALLLGIIAPRFTAEIVNKYPIEHIGGIVASINAFLVILPPITSLVFPMLATIDLSIAYRTFIFYPIVLLFVCMLLMRRQKSKISKENSRYSLKTKEYLEET